MRKIFLYSSYIAVTMVMALALAPKALAASSGPLNAGTGADVVGVGTVTWLNPGNITTVGVPYATTSIPLPIGTMTHYLRGTNYGFSIPGTVTINGIAVTINRTGTQVGGTAGINDNVVSLVKGGSVVGNNYASTTLVWPTSLTTRTYGGSGDMWGTTWTPADINAANFGVVLSAKLSPTSLSAKIATVDYMQITVYYTVAAATPTISISNSPATYNGSPQAATVVGSVAGVVSDIKYDGSATAPTALGTYAVTADFVPTDTSTYNSLNDASAGDFVIKSSSGGGRTAQEKLPPLNTSVLINSDATTTASTAVTLNLAATGATEMILSNPSDFVGAVWEPFATTKSWTLLSGAGEKTVWARFRDAALDTSVPISDSIMLVEAPEENVVIPATTTPPAGQAGSIGGCPTLVAGDMVKVTGKPAIYSLNDKLEALYFPSGDVFKSWRPTYGGYLSITQECFDNLKVPTAYPGAINYRPGSYVVKRAASDQLYVVEPHNALAKISSTDAASLYGVAYKAMTVDDPFWPHYINRGADVSTALPHEGMLIKVNDITYYVAAGNVLREVTADGMTANTFQTKFVHTLSSATISGFSIGEKITAEVPALTNKAQP